MTLFPAPVLFWDSLRKICLLVVLIASGCAGGDRLADRVTMPASPVDNTVEVTFLQLNDVYEITPVEGGKRGGLARVASIRKELLSKNPDTYTVLAGDFLSPSALGTARVDGERLAGRHMVDVLNSVGVDMVTLGNHEFDLSRERLVARIEESNFEYVVGNVMDDKGLPIPGVIPYKILRIRGAGDHEFRVAILGVTAKMLEVDYVTYRDPIDVVKEQVAMLRDSADAFVAVTHMFLSQDIGLANEVPELSLIVGGHEHENILILRGDSMAPIAKADANARSVYVHTVRHDFSSGETTVKSEIRLVTDAVPADPATQALVRSWLDRAFESFSASGLEPEEVVTTVSNALDGSESAVRYHPTRLTTIICQGMRSAAGAVDLAILNSGSIRIDDVIPAGKVTQYDVIRVLPFGGQVMTVEMTGSLLDSVLTQGLKNKGSGGFLQTDGVREVGGIWFLDNGAILPGQTYRVAINDFLVSGREENLEFLSLDNPNAREVARHGDIRLAVIDALRRSYPPN